MTTRAAPRLRAGPGVSRLVLAIGSGVLLAMAFPPYDLLGGWLAIPALALLLAGFRGLRARQGALLGLVAGMAFFLVLLDWMRVLGPDAWVLLALMCAAFWSAMGSALPALLRSRTWVLTVPLLWTCVEALRERIPWGGFPWGRLAFSQAATDLVGWAAVGGPALVSFVVALAPVLVLAGADRLRAGRSRAAAATLAPILLLVLGGAAARGADWGGPDERSAPIAVVQGNVPRLGLDFNSQRRAVLDNHVNQTRALAADVAAGRQPQPVAVLWPENASDIDPIRNADAAAQIDAAADAIGAPILVGAVVVNPADPPRADHPGTILNVGIVWDPQSGPGERYAKRHPVPFGEYLPFRDILSRFISRFDRVPRDFAAGDQVGVLDVGPVRVGVVICFEIAYDELVRDAVSAGGRVLVVQTNNATYGRTGQPEQQLAISRVQAVAAGRTALVAATSGVSAVIDPDGRLRWRTTEFTAASTVPQVPLRSGRTPAMVLGGWLELAAALLLGIVLGWPGHRPVTDWRRDRR